MAKALRVLEQTTHLNRAEIATYLNGYVLDLLDFTVSRHECAVLLEYPSTRALVILRGILERLGIKSIAQLNKLGLAALLNTEGCGERTAWMASMLIDAAGYDVAAWCASGFKTPRAAIADKQRRAARRGKHPVSK